MNDFTMRRNIKTTCWEVLGTIGLPQKREHLLMILKLAEKKGRIDAEIVADELLGPNRDAIAQRLLLQCKKLDLLNNQYELTVLGRKAVENKIVYTPVHGKWLIWTIDDILFPERILKIEKIYTSEQSNNDKDKNDSNIEFVDLPKVFGDIKTKIIELPFGEISECRIIEFKGTCSICHEFNDIVQVSLSGENNNVESSILWNKERRKIENLDEQSNQIRENVIVNSEYEDDWMDSYLLRSYEGLSSKEKNMFLTELDIKHPKHSKYGEFDNVVFRTPIYPRTKADTDKWAEWLMSEKIVDFVFSETDYQFFKEEIESNFPYNSPKLQNTYEKSDEFIDEETGKRNKKYWYLRAANDWKLEGVR